MGVTERTRMYRRTDTEVRQGKNIPNVFDEMYEYKRRLQINALRVNIAVKGCLCLTLAEAGNISCAYQSMT